MRDLVMNCYVSLDGVIEHPERWSLDYFNEDAGKYATDLIAGASALLQGRVTHEGFEEVWNAPSDDAFSQRMFEMPKYVLSRTTTDSTWNNSTVLKGDLLDEVRAIKQAGNDGYVLSYGFGSIAHALLGAGLIDELHLWVHPVFVGDAESSDTIFQKTGTRAQFELAGTTTTSTGVNILKLRNRR